MIGKNCVGCRAEMDADAIFCNECGMAQPAAVSTGAASAAVNYLDPPVSSAFKLCTNCGREIDIGVRFCPGCAFDFFPSGAAQFTEPKCPGCQKLYAPDDRFCRHCAFDLSSRRPISSTAFCTSCGKPFVREDRFCRHCSADISRSDHTVAVPIVSVSSAGGHAQASVPRFDSARDFGSPVAVNPGGETSLRNPSGPHWLSPSAAAFVVICFFLPWLEWSCFGARVPVSGVQLADRDPSFLLFPLAAIVTILVYFLFKAQKTLWKARPFVLLSSAFGLLFLLYKVNTIPSAEFLGTRISASDLGFKPQIGGIGTVAGFIVAIIGCLFMTRVRGAVQSHAAAVPAGWFQPVGTSHLSGGRLSRLRPNKAAMLCYLTPLLGPIVIQVIAIVLMNLFGPIGPIFLLLNLATPFAAQVYFLTKEPQRSDMFVRFHAYQSLFLIALTVGAILISFGVAILFGEGVLIIPGYLVAIGNLIALIFLSVKANRGEVQKLPYVGEWATNYARQNQNAADFSMK